MKSIRLVITSVFEHNLKTNC